MVLLVFLSSQRLIIADGDTASARGFELFQAKCASCHWNNGGDIVGPDLTGVTDRRDSRWLDLFIRQPDVMHFERDSTAHFLLQNFFGVAMPNLGISEEDSVWLLAYLSASRHRPAGPARIQQSVKLFSIPQSITQDQTAMIVGKCLDDHPKLWPLKAKDLRPADRPKISKRSRAL
jgi:cytochrome c